MSYGFKMIMVMFIASALLRFVPFLIFSKAKKLPDWMENLSNNLPLCAMGMLVVYCLKDTSFISGTYGISEIISILFIAITYTLKRNNLISIFGGTLLYLLLINTVF